MTTPKDAALSIRLSADDRAALEAIAAENDEPVAQTARRAIRAFIATAGAVLAIVCLSACGAEQPAAAPTVTVTVDAQGEVVEPEPVVTATVGCWSDVLVEDSGAVWSQWQLDARADPSVAIAVLDALPNPSEGCTEADRVSLQTASDSLDRMRERVPTAG